MNLPSKTKYININMEATAKGSLDMNIFNCLIHTNLLIIIVHNMSITPLLGNNKNNLRNTTSITSKQDNTNQENIKKQLLKAQQKLTEQRKKLSASYSSYKLEALNSALKLALKFNDEKEIKNLKNKISTQQSLIDKEIENKTYPLIQELKRLYKQLDSFEPPEVENKTGKKK